MFPKNLFAPHTFPLKSIPPETLPPGHQKRPPKKLLAVHAGARPREALLARRRASSSGGHSQGLGTLLGIGDPKENRHRLVRGLWAVLQGPAEAVFETREISSE